MITRREAIGLLGSMSFATWLAATRKEHQGDAVPPLAPGTPMSPTRIALIDAFRKRSEGIENKFEARTHKSDWVMPYRLFRPEATGKLPLILFLHGSGGLGDDNLKQMGLGNTFGTRVWALPENQKSFPCYVVVPQTDRGWIRYAPSNPGDTEAKIIPGLGDGARLAFEIVDTLVREFGIDERRIYITGQSMGGGGTWHMMAQRPNFFAAGSAVLRERHKRDNGFRTYTAVEFPRRRRPDCARNDVARSNHGTAKGGETSALHRVRRRRAQCVGMGVY